MSEQPPALKLNNWLLGVLSAAFLAWSGAIWSAIDGVRYIAADVRALRVEITYAIKAIDKHEALPYHPKAGQLLNEIRGRNHISEN